MDYFKKLEKVITYNLDRRGMEGVNLIGELEKAATSLKKADTVLIVTGFVIKDKLFGETDGPIGTVSVAKALKMLGKSAIIITDIYSEKILETALELAGLETTLEIVDKYDKTDFYEIILDKYKPDCLISIERPGEAADGLMYSMTGECISGLVPSMDGLFKEAKKRGLCTIGIGDGGNEIGMGKIRRYVVDNVPYGDIIAASFATDYLILAGVSNWGAHALVAAMSILFNKDLLYSAETGEKLLKAIVNVGAVNGMTKQNTLTVDGLGLDENIKVFNGIRAVVEEYMVSRGHQTVTKG
ncbi:MAG: DUF4392 domain-containing protein [Natronincolaceae bacterium]|nr:DUF4392 domain-containing protein [Bacillota bacterium]NLK90580.1 DUF4392 domain-containing protein [Clostridiales bacterium]